MKTLCFTTFITGSLMLAGCGGSTDSAKPGEQADVGSGGGAPKGWNAAVEHLIHHNSYGKHINFQ